MKHKYKFIFMMNVLLGVVLCVTSYSTVQLHEEAHAAIDEYNGCLDTEIHNYMFSGYETCLNYSEDLTREEYVRINNLHSLNEVIGYNISSLIYYSFVMLVILINLFMFIQIKQEEGQ